MRPTLAENTVQAQQTQEYGTTLQVWQVFQELGSNLSGPATILTFRIKTDVSYTAQFEFTAQNTRIYDKDNGSSSIAGCVPTNAPASDILRGLIINSTPAPPGYMDVSVDFSCRSYTFIPGHRYLLKITNANRGTQIHFATATSLTSTNDYFPEGGLRYTYDNPFEPICNPITYVWKSPINNSGCIVFTSPKDDLYFILGTPPPPSPSPTPSISPSPEPTAKTPLVFIPGIAGSELKINESVPWVADNGHGGVYTNTYDQDETVWINGNQAALPGNDDYFDVLRMTPDGKHSYANITPTGKHVSLYDPTINYLIEKGYVLNKDLFVFGYDWRRDLTETSSNLDSFINQVQSNTDSSIYFLATKPPIE